MIHWLECLCGAVLIFATLAYAGYALLGIDWSPQAWPSLIVAGGRE